MLKNIFLWIIQNVFKIKTETQQKEVDKNQEYARDYEDIKSINFNAIFSNKLSNYVMSDSELSIEGENARVELLNKTGQSMWKNFKKIVPKDYQIMKDSIKALQDKGFHKEEAELKAFEMAFQR